MNNWTSFKVVGNPNSFNELLVELCPIFKDYCDNEWFFTRNVENGLRVLFLRIKSVNNDNLINRISSIINMRIDNYQIANFNLESYNQEIDRYSYAPIENSENIFNLHSNFCMNLFNEEMTIEEKLKLSSIKLVKLIQLFYKNHKEQLRFVKNFEKDFYIEFNLTTNFYKKLYKNYDLIMQSKINHNSLNGFIKNVQNSISNIQINQNLENFIFSHFHMMNNRLFYENQREYELLTYSIANRYLKSLIHSTNV